LTKIRNGFTIGKDKEIPMLNKIFKILPVFIVVWLARKYGESVTLQGMRFRVAFNDVLVREDKK
jgi:hypothetical protein